MTSEQSASGEKPEAADGGRAQCHEPGAWQGQCCCNCINQREVFKHPWNDGEGKSSIMDRMGWACAVMEREEAPVPGLVFFDRQHGMCEMHQPRPAASGNDPERSVK